MRNAFLFFTILLAAGCGHVKVTPSPLFDEGPLSAPCLLEQAANTVILRDYFPTLPSMDTLEVTATAADPWLRYRDIQTADGQKGALVLKNRLPEKLAGADPARVPFITTAPVPGKSDRFYILIEPEADDVLVLWQNTVLDKEHGIRVIDRSKLEITVPLNARKMERSYIRAYAANACGIEEGAADAQTVRDRYAKLILKGLAYACGGGASLEPTCSLFYGSFTPKGMDGTGIMISPTTYFPMLEILRGIGGPEMLTPAIEE